MLSSHVSKQACTEEKLEGRKYTSTVSQDYSQKDAKKQLCRDKFLSIALDPYGKFRVQPWLTGDVINNHGNGRVTDVAGN